MLCITIFRFPRNNTRAPRGTIIFCKIDTEAQVLKQWYKSERVGHLEMTAIELSEDKIVLVGYKSPKLSTTFFLKCLEQILLEYGNQNLVVLGDFNLDLNNDIGNSLLNLLHTHNLHSLLPIGAVTTCAQTQVDIVFSNIDIENAHISDTYFSHHQLLSRRHPVQINRLKTCDARSRARSFARSPRNMALISRDSKAPA